MIEYQVKEIKGQMIGNEDIIWLDCNIQNSSAFFNSFRKQY